MGRSCAVITEDEIRYRLEMKLVNLCQHVNTFIYVPAVPACSLWTRLHPNNYTLTVFKSPNEIFMEKK